MANTLEVTCTFASGSTSTGCSVKFIDTSDPSNPIVDTTLNRQGGALKVTTTVAFAGELQASQSYAVVAYDVEVGGSLSTLSVTQPVSAGSITPTTSKLLHGARYLHLLVSTSFCVATSD